MNVPEAPARTGEELLERARALAPLLREHADATERQRRVVDPVVAELRRSGMLAIHVPRALGGAELDPITSIEVIEALALGDASSAWCAMIGSASSGLASGFLPAAAARAIFSDDPDLAMGSILAPTGMAEAVAGGYRVSGRWRYASFCEHSAFMCVFAISTGGDRPRPRAFLLRREDFEVLDTWHTTGMRGTGSHEILAQGCFVPAEHSFDPLADPPSAEGPFYRYPGLMLATLPCIPLALAGQAVQLMRRHASGGRGLSLIARGEGLVRSARALLYDAIGELWQTLEDGAKPSLEQRAIYRLALTTSHRSAAEAVRLMAELAGGHAIVEGNPLERIARDMATATTHMVAAPGSYETIGSMLLGNEPTSGIL